MVSKAPKQYQSCYKGDGDETKILFVLCKHYHKKVDRREYIRAKFFVKNFSAKYLPPTDFHIVGFTVVDKR